MTVAAFATKKHAVLANRGFRHAAMDTRRRHGKRKRHVYSQCIHHDMPCGTTCQVYSSSQKEEEIHVVESGALACVPATTMKNMFDAVQSQLKDMQTQLENMQSQLDAAAQERDAAAQERDAAAQERDAAARERNAAARKFKTAAQERDALRATTTELLEFKHRSERVYTNHHIYIAHSVIVERIMNSLVKFAPCDEDVTTTLSAALNATGGLPSLAVGGQQRRVWSQTFRKYRKMHLTHRTRSLVEEVERRKKLGQLRDSLFKLLWIHDRAHSSMTWRLNVPQWIHDGIAAVLPTAVMHTAWWKLCRLVQARHEATHPKFVESYQADELKRHLHASLPIEFAALKDVIRDGLEPLTSRHFIETAAPPALSTRASKARASN